MPITSNNPVVVPAADAKVYNLWWVDRLVKVATESPADPQPVQILFRRYRDVNGVPEFMPLQNDISDRRTLNIPDLFALAATNQEAAQVVTALIALAESLGKSSGVIS